MRCLVALLAAWLLAQEPARAQGDIPTLTPELKESPASPGPDSEMLEPVAPPPAAPAPAPEPTPEYAPEPEYTPEQPPEPQQPRQRPKRKKRRHPERPAKAESKPTKPAKPATPEELVIFGAALKYGFTSLAGSASEDDNSPTFGATLYVFQAPSPAKDSLGITAGLMLDYEESEVQTIAPLATRLDGKDATISLAAADLMVCFLSKLVVKICPFVGIGSAGITGESGDFSETVYPYGINVVSGSPRIFSSLGLLAGGQLMLYQPVWRDDENDRNWQVSAGSFSLYLGLQY